MPGLFAIEGERVIRQYDLRHAGDLSDFAEIPGLIDGLVANAVG